MTQLPGHALGKGELAMYYMPYLSQRSATNRLNEWIRHNKALEMELAEAGMRKGQKVLTPRQVQIIVKHLGEP